MAKVLQSCSVINEIARAENEIKQHYKRVDTLERQLRNQSIPPEQEEIIRTELQKVCRLLAENQKQLSTLHKHNRKSLAFAAALCFICFTLYMIYILIKGEDF